MARRAAHAKCASAGEVADCSARLAQGKSNGGLLMGVEANQVRRARAPPASLNSCCVAHHTLPCTVRCSADAPLLERQGVQTQALCLTPASCEPPAPASLLTSRLRNFQLCAVHAREAPCRCHGRRARSTPTCLRR